MMTVSIQEFIFNFSLLSWPVTYTYHIFAYFNSHYKIIVFLYPHKYRKCRTFSEEVGMIIVRKKGM